MKNQNLKPLELLPLDDESLLTRIGKNINERVDSLWSDPLGFTKNFLAPGMLVAGAYLFLDRSSESSRNIAEFSFNTGFMLASIDIMKRFYWPFGRIFHPLTSLGKQTKSIFFKSEFENLVGSEYEKEVIDNIKEHSNLKDLSNYRAVKIKPLSELRDDGAGAFKGGYTAIVTLRRSLFDRLFDSFNSLVGIPQPEKYLKFIHKHSKKHSDERNLEREGMITSLLNNLGFDSVPMVFSSQRPKSHDKYLDHKLNVGVSYEYVDGTSLENILFGRNKDGALYADKCEHLTERGAEMAEMAYDMMFNFYEHPKLNGNLLNNLLFSHAVNRACKRGEVRVRFQGDDFWDERDLVYKAKTEAIEKLGFEPKAPKFRFHNNLVDILSESSEQLSSELDASFYKHFKDVDTVLIHGDLNPGNIIIKGDKKKIIDWDNAGLGIPYEDFLFYSVISGFENNPKYEEVKKKFIDRQEKMIGKLEEGALSLMEFETYATLLHKYSMVANSKEITDECERNFLRSCKYLLNKSRKSLDKYTSETNNEKIKPLFERFAEKNYSFLENIDEKERPDFIDYEVPFAHIAFHGMRKKKKLEQEAENIKEHQISMKEITNAQKNITGTYATIALLGIPGVVSLACLPFAEQVLPYLPTEAATLHDARMFLSAGTGIPFTILGLSGLRYISNLKKEIDYLSKKNNL